MNARSSSALVAAAALLAAAPASAQKIFLNPSDQTGNAVAGGGNESQYAIDNANRASAKITPSGFTTKIVAGLSAATNAANSWGANIFVSIHTNAGGGHGTETFHYTGSSNGTKLATGVQNGLLKRYNVGNRGVKSGTFYVLKYTNMPAALTEAVFHDCTSSHSFPTGSMSESAFLRSTGGRDRMSSGIAEGACGYYGKVCPKTTCSPTTEVCDGKDNDCDGTVDDGNPGGGGSCETGKPGVCAGGVKKCQGGSIVCVASVSASTETCDGKDNDCDGAVDDGNPGGGAACDTGQQGACAAGIKKCEGATLICSQTAQPAAELCDNVDNDCNGAVDDGVADGYGAACQTGLKGVCGVGTSKCQAGLSVCEQSAQASPETCDGLDNDCNGEVDEGNPGGGGTCSTGVPGACAKGTNRCQGGQLLCVQDDPASPETCDGVDNDCDGTVDLPTCPGGAQTTDAGSGGGDPDGGTPVDPGGAAEESGCGCSAGASPALAPAALLLAALLRRRRRG